MNPFLQALCGAAVVCLIGGDAVTIHSEYFAPTDDSMVCEESPAAPHGQVPYARIRARAEDEDESFEAAAFLAFDLSDITPSTTIASATLHLHYFGHDGSTPPSGRHLDLYRVCEDWDEDTLTYNGQPPCDGQRSARARVPERTGQWIEFDVTNDVLAIVAGNLPDHGWKLVDAGTASDAGGSAGPATLVRTKEHARHAPILEIVTPLTGKE